MLVGKGGFWGCSVLTAAERCYMVCWGGGDVIEGFQERRIFWGDFVLGGGGRGREERDGWWGWGLGCEGLSVWGGSRGEWCGGPP